MQCHWTINWCRLSSINSMCRFIILEDEVVTQHLHSNRSDLTRPGPPKGSWEREIGTLISGKSRLLKYYSIWPDLHLYCCFFFGRKWKWTSWSIEHNTFAFKAVLSDSIISKFLWTTLTVLGIGKESVGETQCFGDGKRDGKVVDDVDV